jgi:SulP family sulfate permease
MINVNSGGKTRLSSFVAAGSLLIFILFASGIIEQIPVAVLVGVMAVVVIGTFNWKSLFLFSKVKHTEIFITFLVTIVTVFTNLAVAVLVGIIVSALVFAWQYAKHIHASSSIDSNTQIKTYKIDGVLFFASTSNFLELFSPKTDPKEVYINFASSKVMDHSAIEAIDKIAKAYSEENKILHLTHLSPECRQLLSKAKDIVEVNVIEDPNYHVADDKLN